jgi:predicted nucleotidyltransferase
MKVKEKKKIDEIITYLAGYAGNIPFAFLFGSYAKSQQISLSDIDIAIYFRGLGERTKFRIEHALSMLFDEQVNILSLEDDDTSFTVRLEAVQGIPIMVNDPDLLNRFILRIIHRAEEEKNVIGRLRRPA